MKNSTGSKATVSTSASSCMEPVANDDSEMGPIGVTLKSESALEKGRKGENARAVKYSIRPEPESLPHGSE